MYIVGILPIRYIGNIVKFISRFLVLTESVVLCWKVISKAALLWQILLFQAGCATDILYSLFTCLTCTHQLHVGSDKGITRKYRNQEEQRSTQKVLVANKGNTDKTNTSIHAPTPTAIGCHHTGALNNGGKMKICKMRKTFEIFRQKN